MEKVLVYGMTDNPGGIERYLLNVFNQLNGKGILFDFVTDFNSVAYADELKEKGARIYRIPAKGRSLIAQWLCFWKLLRQHPEYKTVYFNILDAGAALTMLIPWLNRRKIVVHSHNGSTEKVRLHKMCKPLLNLFSAKYIACSERAAEYMYGKRKVREKKVFIVPNAIDLEEFDYNEKVRQKVRQHLGWNDKLIICHVGRLSLQKNPIGLLDIFKEINKKMPQAYLVSVGTGEMEEEVKQYAAEIGLQEKACFLGIRKDISRLLQAADIFILPSYYEGLPIVVLEAQASGLLCMVSDAVTREVDVTGNVYFLPVQNRKAWAERVESCNNYCRSSQKEKMKRAGYDINSFEETGEKLKEYLLK